MTLKQLQIGAAIVASLTVVSAAVTRWAEAKAASVAQKEVAPAAKQIDELQIQFTDHVTSGGHPVLEKKMGEMQDDLAYIRGRIDEKWGKKN